MWIGAATLQDMEAAGRWTVSFFSANTESQMSAYPMHPLRTLVDERRAALDPHSIKHDTINYIGLENIRSRTGELVEFAPRLGCEIKSRSKLYEAQDVLFGRLRPELNKVYLVEDSVSPGICSNEFIILRARTDRITPLYLRYALASLYVTQFAQKLRSGASLPRMSSTDLLDLAIPVPPIEFQQELTASLEKLDREIRELRRRVEWLPTATGDALMASLGQGNNQLSEIEEKLA